MAEVASAYVTLMPSARGFGSALESQVGGETRRTGGKLGAVLGGALKGGAVAAGVAAVGLLGTALTKGFSRLNAIDQAKAKLSGLGNSAKTVDTIMANALSSVKGTAFGLDEAATTAASAVAAGVKPGKELTGVLKTVADTATIAGASMSDTGAIFGSVAARGKLQGDDLMQLQSRGVPVLSFLAKHYGVTAQAASKMVSKGEVDFKNFNAAMQENLGGAALKSGETFTGAFANLKASLGRIGANLLSGLFPQVKKGIGGLTKILTGIEPIATRIGEFIGKGIAQIGPILSKAFQVVGPVLSQVTEGIKVFFGALTGTGSSTKMVVGPMSKIAKIAVTVRDAFVGALPKVRDVLSTLAGFVTGTLLPALRSIASYVMANVVPIFVRLGQILLTNVVPIVLTFAKFLYGTLYPAIVAIVTAVITRLKPVFDQLVATFQARVLPTLALVLAKLREWQPTIQKVISVVVSIIGWVLKLAASILGKVLPVLLRFAGFLLENVVKAVIAVIEITARIIGKLIDFGGAVVGAVKKAAEFATGVRRKFLDVLDFIKGIPGKVTSALGDLGSLLVNAGKEIIGGLLRGITEKFEDVKDFVGGIGSWIGDHKGPLSYDRRLLVPAGKAIMGGLNESLRSEMGSLEQTLGLITDTIRVSPMAAVPRVAAGVGASTAAAPERFDYDRLAQAMARVNLSVPVDSVNRAVVGRVAL